MAEYEIGGLTLSVPDALLTPRLAAKLGSGAYEAAEARAATMRLGAGQRVLELGAGIGYLACLCARVAGARNVVTVEANPDLLPVIRGNLARNGFGAATLVHGAVAGMDGGAARVAFDAAPGFWAGRLAGGDTPPERCRDVPALGLGELFERARPEVVIMDVEGAEEHLFDVPWPGFVHSLVMELHPARYPDRVIRRIVDCMSASGLTYDPGPSQGRILGFRRLRGT